MRQLLLVLAGCLGVGGCAVSELRNDQDRIRCALLELYTNQVMDNLVRASQGLPIIQVDYVNASAQVTVHEMASASDPWSVTHASGLTLDKASALTITQMTSEMVLNTVTGAFAADDTNQVAVTGVPVTASPEVYDAYRQFLLLPGSLQATCAPPPEGAAHLCKQCGKLYYWVPAEYKKQFLGLALAAITNRAAALPPPAAFYSVTILEIISLEKLSEKPDVSQLVVQIDKKIPNDSGRIEVGAAPAVSTNADKKPAAPTPGDPKKPAGPATGDPKKPAAPAKNSPPSTPGAGGGQSSGYVITQYTPPDGRRLFQTDRLVITFPGVNPADLYARFPLTAKVYLLSHRPTLPTADSGLNYIQFQLQQIQFNQIRARP